MKTDIRSARKAKGLTQVDLAAAAGTKQSIISKLENGSRPSVELAPRLSAILGIPVLSMLYPDRQEV
jgi:transcriptional regulator with XRE-family HTH domain